MFERHGNVGVVLREVRLPFLIYSSTSVIPWKVFFFKAGVNLKAVFTPLKIGSIKISRSRFKQSKNSAHPVNLCCGVFCEFLDDFGVYLGGDNFSGRIGKIKRNKEY